MVTFGDDESWSLAYMILPRAHAPRLSPLQRIPNSAAMRIPRSDARPFARVLAAWSCYSCSTPRSAPRALRTAGMKRPDFSYQKMEYKLSEQLRMRFPQMTSLPIGNEYQIIKAEERLRSMTSERRRCELRGYATTHHLERERVWSVLCACTIARGPNRVCSLLV
jgi:hypothetical protein